MNTAGFNAQILLWYKLIKSSKTCLHTQSQLIFLKNKLTQDEVGHSHVLIKVGLGFAQVAAQQTASSGRRSESLIVALS